MIYAFFKKPAERRKAIKRITALLLLCVMIFSAACSGGGQGNSSDYDGQEAESQRLWIVGAGIFSSVIFILVIILIVRNRKAAIKAAAEAIKAAEDQNRIIEEANQRLQSVLKTLPVGIRILSLDDYTLLYSNQVCLDIFGCSSFEEQVQGRSGLGFMPEVQPDGRTTQEHLEEMFATDTSVAEFQCFKLDGTPFICRMSSCTIDYEGHRASLAAMEDVTTEREREQMLINAAAKEQEASQLKSQFLATVSHEMRTPMNAIIGMSELALRESQPHDKDEHIKTVIHAASNLLTIINDVLDFSKIEAGKMEITPAEYSFASLLRDLVDIVRIRAIDSQLRFAVRVDSHIPHTLTGDESRIRQAVLNILSNAVKYTEKGYIRLSVYGQFTGGNSISLAFEVEDSGIGIKEEDRSKLFDKFVQLDIDRNKNVEGIGLGLSITHSVVKAMDGDISVESEYGKGSTFTITIPQTYKSDAPLAGLKHKQKSNVLILVYEQRNVTSDSIAYALKDLGIGYTIITNGDELTEELKSHAYDYLFVPYMLYTMNEETIKKYGTGTKTIILAEFNQGVSVEDAIVLTMPVYCTHIADIFNGELEKHIASAESHTSTVKFTAPGARVLVVDDIHTNLKVAEGLLLQYEMQVDLCNGGAAVVDMVRGSARGGGGRYDLIFMDHKMPGVDGVEATRRIRAMKADPSEGGADAEEYFRNVPIVALTANAISGMVEMFMENGFNDFLSKPIDTVKLNSILEKWIPKSKQDEA